MTPIVIAIVVVLCVIAVWLTVSLTRGPCADCPPGQVCVDGACRSPAACGAGPPCIPPATCVGARCVLTPPCGTGPPCESPAVCVNGACVTTPPPCGAGPPCAAPAVCVFGRCVGSVACGNGGPCTPPAVCIGGAGCGQLQGNCYGWAPLPLATPAIPANAVGAVQTSLSNVNVPMIAVDSGGVWSAGAAFLPLPLPPSWSAAEWLGSYTGWKLDGSGEITSPPTQLYYLAAAAGCALTPATTSDPTKAITAMGRTLCWITPAARSPSGGLLLPVLPGQSCAFGAAMIAK